MQTHIAGRQVLDAGCRKGYLARALAALRWPLPHQASRRPGPGRRPQAGRPAPPNGQV